MSKIKNKFILILLIVIILISNASCTNKKLTQSPTSDVVKSITDTNPNNESPNTDTKVSTENEEVISIDDKEKTNLFPDNKVYDNEQFTTLNINDKEIRGSFVNVLYTDFGIYLPDIITEKKFEDGNEFYLNKESYITFCTDFISAEKDFENCKLEAKEYLESSGPIAKITTINELEGLSEYILSKIDEYGKETDFFLFKESQNVAIIRLTYNEKDRKEVLPILLEVIKTIKYIPSK